jgi:subtilisin family serine protease
MSHSHPLHEPLEARLLLSTTPNDAYYRDQWGMPASAAPAAWDTTRGSAAVVVADIDTGLDYKHLDLYQNVWINPAEIPSAVKKTLKDTDGDGRITFYDLNASANRGKVTDVDKNGRIDAADILTRARYGGWADHIDEGGNGYVDDIVGWDFANNDRSPMDHDGHGTHTAGILGATGNNGRGVAGVNWRVSLMAVKIFDDRGYSASDRTIAAAIRYSADNGARVSNNSWGGPAYSTTLRDAIAYAGRLGQVFVTAAGNDSENIDSPRNPSYPAAFSLDNIIDVAATEAEGTFAWYSDYGRVTVDVSAPGSDVLSTLPGNAYGWMSGTSMASPFVAGAAALMLAKDRSLSAAQIKARIIGSADQSRDLAGTSVSNGELNIANALANRAGVRVTTSSH